MSGCVYGSDQIGLRKVIFGRYHDRAVPAPSEAISVGARISLSVALKHWDGYGRWEKHNSVSDRLA
jgi:hypothetical protein